MNSPFFFVRVAMILAVLTVVGLIVWLIMLENNRVEPDSLSGKPAPTTFTDIDQAIERGTADDILILVNQLPQIPANANYIVRAEQLLDRIKLFSALVEREKELDGTTRGVVFRGLLRNQLELHTLNLFENVEDHRVRNELLASARDIINSAEPELSKDAHITLTAVAVLEVFSMEEETNDLQPAKSAMNDLMRMYPNDNESINSMYLILTQFGAGRQHYGKVMELLSHMNQLCLSSDDQKVREIGEAHYGRVLLIKAGILNVAGRLDFHRGDDEAEMLQNIKDFFNEEYGMSVPVAEVIATIAVQMEQWNINESALLVYRMLTTRLAETRSPNTDEKLIRLAAEMDRGIKRMEAKGKLTDFPDTVSGKNNLVMFVNNSDPALQSAATLANLRIVSANQDLKIILVSFDEDPLPLKNFIRDNNLKGLTLVSDPERKSAYYQFFPAKFMPSVIIIARDGTALDVNVNLGRLEEFLKVLVETE